MKLIFCLRRNPRLTADEFQEYWLRHHAELMTSSRQAIPSMTKYVQSHTVYGPLTDAVQASRGTREPYDGVAEVWLDTDSDDPNGDPEAAAAAMQRLLADEMTFIDMAHSSIFLTEERTIFE